MALAISFSLLSLGFCVGFVIPKVYTVLVWKKQKDKNKNRPGWLESASYIVDKYDN